jgi:hypothetical protein
MNIGGGTSIYFAVNIITSMPLIVNKSILLFNIILIIE